MAKTEVKKGTKTATTTFSKDAVVGYSMKLKAKSEFVNPVVEKTAKGYVVKGQDTEGNNMAAIVSESKALELIKAKKAKKGF